MNARLRLLPLVAALVLSACQAVPVGGGAGVGIPPGEVPAAQADGQVYGPGERYRILAVEELPVVAITSDGDVAGFPKARLHDGDLGTQWSSAAYRAATAWAAVELAQDSAIAVIRIKTGPTPSGTSYEIQVSDDGASWRTAAVGGNNSTWGLESKPMAAGTHGKYVRIFWRNSASAPQPRFSIYELAIDGTPGAAPTPVPTPVPTATPTPQPTPQPTATPPASTPGPVTKLPIAAGSASSSYTGLAAGRAIDGDLATQWANGGYKELEATYTLDLGRVAAIDHLRVKTGYLPARVTYDLETSEDGTTWRVKALALNNGSWNLVQRPLAVRARHVRLRFHNDPQAPIARMPLYELEAWGRASATTVARTLRVMGATHRTQFGPAIGIGGTWQTVIDVEANAFNDTTTGARFPAMLGLDRGRPGWTYARITPANAQDWGGDIGGSGAVSFLDTSDGLADNAGSWIFTHRDFNDEVYPIEATTAAHTTTWRTDRAASLDLGSTPRKWNLSATEVGGPGTETPGAFVVYKRPDGVWDFAQASGNSTPSLSSFGPIETSGRVYAFFVTARADDFCPDLDLGFTALD